MRTPAPAARRTRVGGKARRSPAMRCSWATNAAVKQKCQRSGGARSWRANESLGLVGSNGRRTRSQGPSISNYSCDADSLPTQPLSLKSRTSSAAEVFEIGLCGVVQADLERTLSQKSESRRFEKTALLFDYFYLDDIVGFDR